MPAFTVFTGPCACCGDDVNGCGPANACAGYTTTGYYRRFPPFGGMSHTSIGTGFATVPQSDPPHDISDDLLLRGPYPSALIAAKCDPGCTGIVSGRLYPADASGGSLTLPDMQGPWQVTSYLVTPGSEPPTYAAPPPDYATWAAGVSEDATATFAVTVSNSTTGETSTLTVRWVAWTGWQVYEKVGDGNEEFRGPVPNSTGYSYFPLGGITATVSCTVPSGAVHFAGAGFTATVTPSLPGGFDKLVSLRTGTSGLNGAYWRDVCYYAGGCGSLYGPAREPAWTVCEVAGPPLLYATLQWSLSLDGPWTTFGSAELPWLYGIIAPTSGAEREIYHGQITTTTGRRVAVQVTDQPQDLPGYGALQAFLLDLPGSGLPNVPFYTLNGTGFPMCVDGGHVFEQFFLGFADPIFNPAAFDEDQWALHAFGLIPEEDTPHYVRLLVDL